MSDTPHYAMVIEWSDEDQTYVVSFPEWEATGLYFVHTHGDTYTQAVRSGQDLLAELIAVTTAQGKPLPEPRHYAVSTP